MERSELEKDVIAADTMKLSYGYYKALSYDPGQSIPYVRPKPKRKRRPRPRKFQDSEAFVLWQKYMTDEEIASVVGVSRAYIQQWRDQLELPSTSKTPIDTKKYRLEPMPDGTSIILRNDEV